MGEQAIHPKCNAKNRWRWLEGRILIKVSKNFLFFLLLSLVLQGGGILITPMETVKNVSIGHQKVQVKTIVLKRPSKVKKNKSIGTLHDKSSNKLVTNETKAANIPYLKRLADKIQANVIYPINARRKRHTGVVMISFDINKNGKIQNITLSKPSEHSSLNSAAIHAIEKTNDETREIPPPEIFTDDMLSLRQIVEFK